MWDGCLSAGYGRVGEQHWCGPTLWFLGDSGAYLHHVVIAHTQFVGIHLVVVVIGVHGTRVRFFGIVVGVDQPCGVWVVAHIPVGCRYNTVWV